MNNDRRHAGMAEATRLVRAGRLAEATALIQRTLGSMPVPNVSVVDAESADAPGVSALPLRDDSWPTAKPLGESMARNRGTGGDALTERLAAALSTLHWRGAPGSPDSSRARIRLATRG